MKKYIKFTILLVGLFIATISYSSSSENILPAFTAQYDLFHGNSKIGSSTKQLSYPQPGKYSYTADTSISVLIVHQKYLESSDGLINDQGFKPLSYKLSSTDKVVFQTADLQSNQDSLSQELMLRYFLATDQIPSSLSVITAKGTEIYNFNIIQTNEMIAASTGNNMACTHIRFFDHEGNQVDEWLAKQYAYLPVVIKISKNGAVSSAIYLSAIK
jgi:hypothetical protein